MKKIYLFFFGLSFLFRINNSVRINSRSSKNIENNSVGSFSIETNILDKNGKIVCNKKTFEYLERIPVEKHDLKRTEKECVKSFQTRNNETFLFEFI